MAAVPIPWEAFLCQHRGCVVISPSAFHAGGTHRRTRHWAPHVLPPSPCEWFLRSALFSSHLCRPVGFAAALMRPLFLGGQQSTCSIPPVMSSCGPRGSLGRPGLPPPSPVAVSLAEIGSPAEERPLTFQGSWEEFTFWDMGSTNNSVKCTPSSVPQ